MELFFQYLVAGVTYGIIYAIVAIGFNIIYNTTGIINFAQRSGRVRNARRDDRRVAKRHTSPSSCDRSGRDHDHDHVWP